MQRKTIRLISGLITLVITLLLGGLFYFIYTEPELAVEFIISVLLGCAIIWLIFSIYTYVEYCLDDRDHRARRRRRGM